jgi:hypothetical protein
MDKSVTNNIKIIRELSEEEKKFNTGNWNTGNRNTGDSNTGNRNTGSWNTGDRNTGSWNTGSWNTGNRNTGSWNTGSWNTGDRNTGYKNTGDRNTGNSNTGDSNTGHRNTGYRNTGYRNTGDRNTGNRNTGSWNTGSWNTGFFNTTTPEKIQVFNQPCKKSDWDNAYKPDFLFFNLTEWIHEKKMTDREKEDHPEYKTLGVGGYLWKYNYKEAFKKAWDEADPEDRIRVKDLPNFDAKIFYEISGINVEEEK